MVVGEPRVGWAAVEGCLSLSRAPPSGAAPRPNTHRRCEIGTNWCDSIPCGFHGTIGSVVGMLTVLLLACTTVTCRAAACVRRWCATAVSGVDGVHAETVWRVGARVER